MSLKTISKKFISFDGQESVQGFLYRPDKYKNLEKAMQVSGRKLIPSGAQLSYGLSFAGSEVLTLSSEIFNRILDFNPTEKTITVESGMCLLDLLGFLVSKGFWFPVLPGYPNITIGGCLGSNVHGKSQFQSGNFYDYVDSFVLIHPDHGRLRCSRQNMSDIFDLTIGGFGFTGFVVQVKLNIQKLKGSYLQKTTIPVSNLVHAAELISHHESDCDQIYSWHDLTLKGSRFGSGFVYLEKFIEGNNCDLIIASSRSQSDNQNKNVNVNKSHNKLSVLNRQSYKNQLLSYFAPLAVNRTYHLLESLKPKVQVTDVLKAAFPIQGKEIYYDAFGKRGFCEYQMIIPKKHWTDFVNSLQSMLDQANVRVTLASLKLFKGKKRYLHFSDEGVCLALDVVYCASVPLFLNNLDQLVIKYNGLPNIAKDSRINQKIVTNCFEKYENFKQDLLKFDPNKRFSSSLRERLGV